MYLNKLDEEQKNAFVNLCFYAAKSNLEYPTVEREIIQDFCKEMGIVYFDLDGVDSIGDSISKIISARHEIKKIILFGILQVLNADGKFDYAENKFLLDLAERMEFDKAELDELVEVFMDYKNVVEQIKEFIIK